MFEIPFFRSKTQPEKESKIPEIQEDPKPSERSPETKILEIAELREPTKKLLEAMRNNIERGEYAALLGDDASGRIPTLLFHRILGALYKERGFPIPKTLFFAGQALAQEAENRVLSDFTNWLEKNNIPILAANKKILIVTDTISTGSHLLAFTRTLQKLGVKFDIATIGSYAVGGLQQSKQEEFLGGTIFRGMHGTPHIYTARKIGGVEKSGTAKLFAKRRYRNPDEKSVALSSKYVIEAREDVKVLGDELVEWYRKQGNAEKQEAAK